MSRWAVVFYPIRCDCLVSCFLFPRRADVKSRNDARRHEQKMMVLIGCGDPSKISTVHDVFV